MENYKSEYISNSSREKENDNKNLASAQRFSTKTNQPSL